MNIVTWDAWLNWAYLELKKSFNSRRDAEILLIKVLNKSRTQLLAFGETELKCDQIIQLNSLIARRKKGEPIAYLVGSKEFWSLNFKIESGTFIPRPDTECLVEQVLNLFPISTNLKVLDLGTGVGTIALSLASERPNWNITGIDKKKSALILSRKNQLSFNYNNVQFIYGNWFKYLKKEKFNLIVSNPPYVSKHDLSWVDQDIRFEPQDALISKNMGLSDLIIICKNSIDHLYPNGWLFLEHGWNQGKYVRNLFYKFGFDNICTVLDYCYHERITYGRWNPNINF